MIVPMYTLIGDKLTLHSDNRSHIVRVTEDPNRMLACPSIHPARSDDWWRRLREAMELQTPFERVLAVAKLGDGRPTGQGTEHYTRLGAIWHPSRPWNANGYDVHINTACEVIRGGFLRDGEARVIRLQREGAEITMKVLA